MHQDFGTSLRKKSLNLSLKDSHSFGLLPNFTLSEICHLPDLISEAGQLDPFFRGFHLERTFSILIVIFLHYVAPPEADVFVINPFWFRLARFKLEIYSTLKIRRGIRIVRKNREARWTDC
jgi:hypothetical protein